MKNNISFFLILVLLPLISMAQKKVSLKINPDPIVVEVGKTLQLNIKAVDEKGNVLKDTEISYFPVELKGVQQSMIFTGGFQIDANGLITGRQPGVFDMFITRMPDKGESFANEKVVVKVINQEIVKLDVRVGKVYEGAVIPLEIKVLDKGGFLVANSNIKISSSNQKVLKTDKFLNIHALQKGKSVVSVSSGNVKAEIDVEVLPNPITQLDLRASTDIARTGDVVYFRSTALDKSNKPVTDVPLMYSLSGQAHEFATGPSAQVDSDGRFVAEEPGLYTVTVISGNSMASASVEIVERNVSQKIDIKGHGRVNTKHTSDFWVWEGVDGKDYAVTGTWGADGKAYFWEVTNPSNIVLIDSIQVDARTVNDVKVSEDGKICVISREGASNRKNGIVILDVENPRDVKILSTYTENLTGGVHNVFIDKGYVYALSNGQWYEVVDIKDPKTPKGVSKFMLSNSMTAIHDVWIENGIAYSSNWSDGIAMVDIGNGVAGGSPEKPVEIARAHVQGDGNHAAFPYKSKETGKFYVIAGDEIFPLAAMSSPDMLDIFIPDGYLHFMDMTDPKNPKEVARYQVPEAGSHNFWVDGDVLYIGYYNGGLRVVDISGDLMGDLYKQGREIAHYIPYDSEGFVPNSPFVWGAQPYKGHIFFSDFNSGLWSGKLAPVKPKDSKIETK